METEKRQKLITSILANVLDCEPEPNPRFDWFKNKHEWNDFRDSFEIINHIFSIFNGVTELNSSKRTVLLTCDAFFGEPYNFMFEFDEFQHFSTYRLLTLENYPEDLGLGFDLEYYYKLCNSHKLKADNYRKNKTTVDFPFIGGRTAQRAYLDSFRDLLPKHHLLKPTIRINEYQVQSVTENNESGRKIVEDIVKQYL